MFLRYLIVLLTLSISASAQNKMIDEIKADTKELSVWWAGHNSWIIKSGDLVVATDLFLQNNMRYKDAPITPEELASELDISFVTHAHDDHFNEFTSKILVEKSKCLFVMPESCVENAKKFGIPVSRIKVVSPRETFDLPGVKVQTVRAIHGNANFAIYYEANLQDCGYVLTIGGKTFLQPGDSYLLEDHLFLKQVDVLFFSPTEHNMYIDRSVILINALNPEYILPQHHSTIKYDEANRFWAKGYPDEVKIHLSKPLQDRYHILKPGDKIIIK